MAARAASVAPSASSRPFPSRQTAARFARGRGRGRWHGVRLQRAMNTNVPELLSDVVGAVEGTDRGSAMTDVQRDKVDDDLREIIQLVESKPSRLQQVGAGASPLDSPDLFGNYRVLYSSSGDKQRGQPAGGRFRGILGRTLFRTTGLYQYLGAPNVVNNLVTFRLFGLIPGCITLLGTFEKTDEPNEVEAKFERPRFTLAGQTLAFGPPSSVKLSTPLVDSAGVRLGRGSRGSLFIFSKDGDASDPQVMKQYRYKPSRTSFVAAAVCLCATLALLYEIQAQFGPKPLMAATAVLLLLGSVLKSGGIVRDDADTASAGA